MKSSYLHRIVIRSSASGTTSSSRSRIHPCPTTTTTTTTRNARVQLQQHQQHHQQKQQLWYHTSNTVHQQQQQQQQQQQPPSPTTSTSTIPTNDATATTTTTTTTASTNIIAPPKPPPIPMKYESHEYPWATEPPIITRTTATVAAAEEAAAAAAAVLNAEARMANETTNDAISSTSTSTSNNNNNNKNKKSNENDHTDGSIWSTMTQFVTNLFAPSTTTTSSSSSMASFASIAAAVPNNSNYNYNSNNSSSSSIDHFDDQQTMTPVQVQEIRQRQHFEFQTMANTSNSKLEPVTTTIPSYIPTTNHSQQRPIPETIVTTLSNGIRIVSQETYGHISTIGIVSNMGSRYEIPNYNTGVTNLTELLAFGTTNTYRDNQQLAHQLQEWLGTRFVITGREQSLLGIDVLRPNVTLAMELLADVVLHPHFTTAEIDPAKDNLQYLLTHDDLPPEFIMSEAINTAAFGLDQQLGQPHGCPLPQLPKLNRNMIQDWWKCHMIQNPHGLVLGGAGMDHDALVKLGEQHFGHLQQRPNNESSTGGGGTTTISAPMIPSTYRGGYKVVALPPPIDGGDDLSPEQYSVVHREKRLTRVAVGIDIGGWFSDNMVPMCVLQALLGGGSSFSAGGPGKGMYSRLYRQILNRYHWADSAEAFNTFHHEAGLLGITGRTEGRHATDMVKTFCLHLKRLAVEPVTEEELDRARNMLRNDVMTQLESRFVLFEDMSRQVLTYNKREPIAETVARIDAVTAEQIQSIIAKAIMKPPTFSAVGVDVQNVPSYEQVCEWLRR